MIRNGKPVLSAPKDPTAEADVAISQQLAHTASVHAQTQNKVAALEQNYSRSYKSAEADVEKIIKEQWPFVEQKDAPEMQIAQQFYNAVPEVFHDHPATKVASLMWVTINQQNKMIQELQAKQVTNGKILKDKELMDPKVTGGAANGSVSAAQTEADIRSRLRINPKSRWVPPAEINLAELDN
jgi:hypothetical protein